MIPIRSKTLTAAVLAFACGTVGAQAFPPAEALEWHTFETVHVKLQVPKGWSRSATSTESTQAFFVSRSTHVDEGKFEAGMSLNVVSFPQDVPQGALAYATSFATSYAQKFGPGAECGWKAAAPLTLYWCQADIEDAGHSTTALHHLVANSMTGKLYIFMFESLREDWQQSWPTITTMLKSIDIDPLH